jgi:hypothetical protein
MIAASLAVQAGCSFRQRAEFPPDPPSVGGIHDGSPALSHDGRTLAWFHREDEKAFLCVLTFPWDRPPRKVEVPAVPHKAVDFVQLSGDGRHAFVNGLHVEIVDGAPAACDRLPEPVGPFGVATSFDGSKVATHIEGDKGGLKFISREGGRYTDGPMVIPRRDRRLLGSPLMSGDGNLVECCGSDFSLCQAGFRDGDWDVRTLTFEREIGMSPLALSADGRNLLLAGINHNPGRTVEHIYLSSRDTRGRWQEPQRLLGLSAYMCTMSSDANTIAWAHYTRDAKGHITRTELKFIRRKGDGWTEPTTVFDRKRFTQFMTIALSNSDTIAYALADAAKPPGSCAVFLRPDLKPETQPININERVGSGVNRVNGK